MFSPLCAAGKQLGCSESAQAPWVQWVQWEGPQPPGLGGAETQAAAGVFRLPFESSIPVAAQRGKEAPGLALPGAGGAGSGPLALGPAWALPCQPLLSLVMS